MMYEIRNHQVNVNAAFEMQGWNRCDNKDYGVCRKQYIYLIISVLFNNLFGLSFFVGNISTLFWSGLKYLLNLPTRKKTYNLIITF